MLLTRKTKLSFAASFIAFALTFGFGFSLDTGAAMAQDNSQPQVSVVTLKAVKGPRGGTAVITPKGVTAPLPGAGVNGNTAQIYIGSNGGYWYTDKNGACYSISLEAKLHQQRL